MIVRISILVISIILHFLTPSWFLSDFLLIGEWIMMSAALVSVISYKTIKKNNRIIFLSLFLSINILIYFVATAQVLTHDVEIERAVWRLQIIFTNLFTLSIGLSKFLEELNAIQVIGGIIMCIILGLLFYKSMFKKGNLSQAT
jgi:hypothetical protein